MRGTRAAVTAFVLSLAVVSPSTGEDKDLTWKGKINPAWESSVENLLSVLDGYLRKCDLMIATPEADDAKTYDLWLAETAAYRENYGILMGSIIADGELYITEVSEFGMAKRARFKAAVSEARRFQASYDWFMGSVLRAGGIMAMSWVRDVNRETGYCEDLVKSAKPIFDKLVESVEEASADISDIQRNLHNARSRREVEVEEKRLAGVARRLRNVRYVLLARKVLAEKFFGENRDDELGELLAKTRERFKLCGENEKVSLLLPRHWKHIKLWMDLMMKKWEDYSTAMGEATQKWQPFLNEKIFDSVTRFKNLKYSRLEAPVEAARALAKERRSELR